MEKVKSENRITEEVELYRILCLLSTMFWFIFPHNFIISFINLPYYKYIYTSKHIQYSEIISGHRNINMNKYLKFTFVFFLKCPCSPHIGIEEPSRQQSYKENPKCIASKNNMCFLCKPFQYLRPQAKNTSCHILFNTVLKIEHPLVLSQFYSFDKKQNKTAKKQEFQDNIFLLVLCTTEYANMN